MHLRPHLTYANVVATLALAVAVAGVPTAIAITKSSAKPDVTAKGKIRAGRVTTSKLAEGAVTPSKLGPIQIVSHTGASTGDATCSAGQRLLGGGASVVGGDGSGTLQASNPSPDGKGWHAATRVTLGEPPLIVYALCLG